MKTICFVVPNFPVASETFVTNQIIALKTKGYDVLVLTQNLRAIEQSTQKHLLQKHDILQNAVEIDYKLPKSKIKRIALGIIPILKHFKYWLKTPHISIKHRFTNLPYLLKFFSKFRHIDVFHIQFVVSGRPIAAMTANGFLKGKVITTFHGHDAHYSSEDILKFLQNRYKVLFKVSSHITVNTSYLVPNIITLGCDREKIEIVPMGIDVNYFDTKELKQLPSNTVVKLLSIGRLITLKGFALAIDAVKLLVDKGMKVEYTIVGEGYLYQNLKQYIQTLGLNQKVTLVGNKNQSEIRDLLERHHLYLMSSITDSKGRAEAQGIVTAEAQAMGLPVIAFDSGGVPNTLRHNETGFLVPEKNVEAYAHAISVLVADPLRYQKMSRAARHFAVNEFSKEQMSNRFIKLYKS